MERITSFDLNHYRDTGMAFCLIGILAAYFLDSKIFLVAAGVVLIITMTVPVLFKPLSIVWFGFSYYLGTFVTKIILSILFFTLVTPVGLFRKLLGKDPLNRKYWNQGETGFKDRQHQFNQNDFKNPF